MTAPDRKPKDGLEAAALVLWRRLGPREQRAWLDALLRHVDDGQPFEDAMAEALVELGDPPRVAHEEVRKALADRRRDWRQVLN
jgi:uncharacterized membrane protein